jgi:amino acid adenylation domain-containing protein
MDSRIEKYSKQTVLVETLTAAQRQIVLGTWNDTQINFPEAMCIHQLFEAQAAQTPDAVAVAFEDQQLTYQQLNQQANQLAHHLRTLGVRSEVLVGIYIERSLEMVVGMLGILKAGGAYVPLDPAHPLDRLAFILEETQVLAVLTQAHLADSLPSQTTNILCLDSDWEVIAQKSQENLAGEAIASSLMYTIYTSGSTGQPKGVMISHAGICNQLHWRQTTFPLTECDRVLQTISFSFDPSVWQIFWPLSCGAQLVLPRPGGHQDSAYLVEVIAQQQITVIALVPSMLRVFLEEKGIEQCRGLRHVFCGGEALPADLQERFFARLNLDNVLHNVYGPTEASIDATFWTCQRGTNQPIAPIGRPLANTQVFILDSDLQPVAIGEPGELHIGGIGLARGYLNRPELTAEKFIPNPYSSTPGDRLYKTGDLARYLPDGNIEFLGRIDHQVKVRGFRIELGEIEAALSQHFGVQQTVVIAREDMRENQRLVAYIVPRQQPPTASELRTFLKAKLPEYMVPSAFVVLKTLPLNPNGKVDRRALPAPDQERPLEEPLVAPQDELELQLTKLWEQVLNIQPLGVKDNFFDLGGNSLLAVRLTAQIEEVFSKKLPLSTFFQAPTVEQLASILRQEEWNASWQPLVAIQPNGSKPPLFCVHSRTGNVFNYYCLSHYLGDEQPFYGLQARRIEEEQTSQIRVEDLAVDYIKEIQILQSFGPYFLAGYSFGGLVAYEMARQLSAQGQEVALLALIDTYNKPSGWFKPLSFRDRLSQYLGDLSRLELGEKLSYAQEKLQLKLKGKLVYMQEKLMSKFLPNTRLKIPVQESSAVEAACVNAERNYIPQAYSGRTILFRASEPLEFTGLRSVQIDRSLGWDSLVSEGIEVHEVQGHHFNVMDESHVEDLAEKLKACLSVAQAEYIKLNSSSLRF